ncbi:MAG: PH domain-containing protein [Acidimicrobiales bacterium]
MQPLPHAVRRLWRASALIGGAVIALVGGTVTIAVSASTSVPNWLVAIPVVAGLTIGALSWLTAGMRYRSWRFELTEDWIHARWGVVTHHAATIPRNRVQTLTSENGPLDRMLGLTSITVHTAGAGAPNLSIPHLEDTTVEWLRSELASGATD